MSWLLDLSPVTAYFLPAEHQAALTQLQEEGTVRLLPALPWRALVQIASVTH